MQQKFFKCAHCGNLVATLTDSGVPMMCCGQKMTELKPGVVEASVEKHLPVYTLEGSKLYAFVGDVEHPMLAEHYIEWIALVTRGGVQIKRLSPADKPAACFTVAEGDEAEAVYAYCNLHGLWMAEVKEVPVCDLKPVTTDTNENYVVCKCNNVTYFDILNAAHSAEDIGNLLKAFEAVKNTTHCSTGCGGCYGKVVSILSDMMSGKLV